MIFKFFFMKEMKKYPFFFILLFFTSFLGTLGLIGISIVSGQIQEKLKASANELLTSDIAVSARRELFSQEQKILRSIFSEIEHREYKVIDIYSMVTHQKKKTSRLVEIRSSENGFPFYGKITLQEGEFSNQDLFISRDLADLWQVFPGEELKVGDLILKISGIVERDSSLGLRGFSLAPRIYLPLTKLTDTGLLRPGATGSFSYHFKLKEFDEDRISQLKGLIYDKIKDPAVKITLPQDSSEQTGRVINVLTNFMALSAMVGLILSLIGIFYLYQSHLHARLKDLCLLNLYGISKKQIIAGISAQFSFVFFLVMIFEIILIIPLYDLLAPLLSNGLGLELGPEVNVSLALRDIPFLFGLALFVLVPLLFGLMRTEMGVQLKAQKISMGRFRFFDFLPFILFLWLFSGYIGHSFKTGNIFFAALILVFSISTAIVKCGQWIIKKLISGRGLRLPNLENGIALRSLTRSGHKLTLSFLSLAMGATLISFILQLDKMILKEFSVDNKKPSLFIFDIQEEQMDPFVEAAKANGSPLAFMTPMIRARLEKVNDSKFVRNKKDFDFRAREEDEDARFRNNGLNLTYRSYLTDAERIIKGSPFPPGGTPEGRLPFISLEKRWSERMGIALGDKLTFDVQGVEFEGVVHNIKEVKWTSFYPNFFVTVEPGIISAAPKTVLAIRPSGSKEKKLSLQRLTVEKFPNISFIDVGDLVGKLSQLFENSRKAIEIISWLSLGVGLIILYGLSHDQVYRRYYDIALLKTLGFSPNRVRLNLLHEFGTVFFSAMAAGLFLGWFIAQIIGRELFKLSWSIDLPRIIYPAILLSVLCLATIIIASWRAVQAKPRELLSDA